MDAAWRLQMCQNLVHGRAVNFQHVYAILLEPFSALEVELMTGGRSVAVAYLTALMQETDHVCDAVRGCVNSCYDVTHRVHCAI